MTQVFGWQFCNGDFLQVNRSNPALLSVPLVFASTGCGGGGGGGSTPPPQNPTITSVSVSCTPASVQTGQASQCTATVSGTGSYSSAVTWSAVSGTISSSGLYTAPASIPASGSDTITATSSEDATKSGKTTLTITRTPPSGSWQFTGPAGASALDVLAEDPSSPNTVYADGYGNGASGLWKSVDSGKTWAPMITNSALDTSGASDIAVLNAGQVLYVSSVRNTLGTFYSSTDGGVTWKTSHALSSGSANIGGMAVDPQNYATVYLSAPGLGVVKSIDQGATWTLLSSSPVITTGSSPSVLHNPIAVDLKNTSTIYYGTDHGLYITTDGGSTWKASTIGIASGDVQIQDVAVDSANPSIVFLLAGITNSSFSDLYESTNAGNAWTPLATGLDAERVVPDPNNANIIYLSGLVCHAAYKSSDGGHTFIASDTGTPTAGSSCPSGAIGFFGPTGTIIPLKSSANSFLLVSNGAGVYQTNNGAQSWSVSNTGLSAFNGDALAVDPEKPATIYFGSQNGGGIFKSTDTGMTWTNLRNGDSIWDIAVDPFDSTHILAVAYEEGLIASHDGGNTWTNISSHLPTPSSFAVIVGVHFHPQQQGTIFVAAYSGGVGFMRSSDGGTTFASYNSGLSTTQVGGCVAINPQNPQILLIADGAGLATSSNGGNTWVETASSVSCPFSVDAKSNPPTIYAANVTSFNGVKSIDFGKTWTTLNVGTNLIADPSTANSVFAISTATGMWSPDAGATWYSLLTSGLGQILLLPGGYNRYGLTASGAGLVIAPTSPQVLFVASWTHSLARFAVGP